MPKHLAESGTFEMSGEYDFYGHGPNASPSKVVLPNGATAPDVSTAQIFYIPASGVLAISDGTTWRFKASA